MKSLVVASLIAAMPLSVSASTSDSVLLFKAGLVLAKQSVEMDFLTDDARATVTTARNGTKVVTVDDGYDCVMTVVFSSDGSKVLRQSTCN
jgi:hypothetical protein